MVSIISVLCMLVFAEIQIIDEYTNVSYSPPASTDTTEDQTKLSSEELNEKMCLVHQEKNQETAKGTDNKFFSEKRKRYNDDKEVKVSYIRNRYSDNFSYIKGSDVFVALEIGLTYSGIAVCLWGSRQETKMYLLTWVSKDQGTINSKISTTILFRPDKSPDSIGNDAESNHCGGNHNNLAEWSYFKNFMLSLCDEQEMESEDMQIWDVQKKCRMKAVDVISSFIKNMKQKLLIDLVKSDLSCISTDIQWVLTVPAIWNNKSKQIMSQAAEIGGLSRDKFILLEEPEAVLKYYSTYDTQSKKLPASYRCIVLHVGDNAINSTVMKVKDDTYTMKSTVFSQYGGVTQEVFRLLNDLFSDKVTNYCEENHPHEYMTLFYNVEKKMKYVQPNTDVRIRVPLVWFEVFEEINLIALPDATMKSHFHQDVTFVGDKMKIEYKLFQDYYNNFIQCRLQVVEKILAKESVAGISVLFLAGDFIENVFVDALKRQYPEHIICVANDPNEVILRGALL